jgi:hypothetical protein
MAGRTSAARRICARVTIPLVVVGATLALGLAPALADPGNGNGNPNPPGQGDPPGNGNGAAAAHATNGNSGTFGSPTSPQPVLHPGNQNGANANPGPYSSTRNGAPSLNGNGNGAAVGQPCAGCVGKADNKNPPGQFPNGTDPNAGYECDSNNGIGQTNPAHTGCVSSPPIPVTPPVPVSPPISVTPVGARTPGELVSPVSLPSVSLPSVSLPAAAGGALPVTGGNVLVLVLVALGAVSVGGALTVLGRRRLTRA